ncbi:hypothetical protein ACFYUM_14205 [Streptomyces fimicarius]|uniref:DUF317 domain-containing protein n=2 Tax=Streptomyces TaxID=1883 RepID=A0AB33KSD7_9ACTN|nr:MULTISPECIES: hypothetical protein [Streptomyces]MCL6289803.1 hypothetical protein [Streptomyces sp. 43Y-GA-1]MCX4713377.1 hypothetical protein [Streptomyces griseus]MDX2672751.1 hypothetical protein [Streptomyces sp. NRRL_ISP-5395]MDX3340510.1 hypothetical protein [Streptomyces sp. ME02-6979.5a]MDX3503810.1 hypothetical protein [Streptomyces sp. ATCC51928]
MSWASWTTSGVYTGTGGVRTEEAGILSGDLTVHTTWFDGQAAVAVQYSGSSDWFTLTGSPVPCPSEEESRRFHQSVVEAVRAGEGATVPPVGAGPA